MQVALKKGEPTDYLNLLNLKHTDGNTIRVQPNRIDQLKLDELRATEWKTMPQKRAIDAEIHSIVSKYAEQSRNRLNEMIRNERFLDANRHLLTLVGERIPVQGLNSMEFMEIAEFLPSEAGNLIVLPTEIVAKSGGDYDFSVLSVRKPNIKVYRKFSISRSVYNSLMASRPDIDIGFDEANKIYNAYNNPLLITALTREQKAMVAILNEACMEVKEVNLSNEELAAAENNLIKSASDLLKSPELFIDLTLPSRAIHKDLLRYMQGSHYPPDGSPLSPSKLVEPLFNLFQYDKFNQPKRAVPISFVHAKFAALCSSYGVYLNNEYRIYNSRHKQVAVRPAIYLGHNKAKENKASLSHLYDVKRENKIGGLIQQLIQMQLSVGSHTVLYSLNITEYNLPVILLLMQIGTPLQDILAFINEPVTVKYVKALEYRRDVYAKARARSSCSTLLCRIRTFNELTGQDFRHLTSMSKYVEFLKASYDPAVLFSSEGLRAKDKTMAEQAIILHHYFMLEDLASRVTKIKHSLRWDIPSSSFFSIAYKRHQYQEVKRWELIPSPILEKIKHQSYLKSFDFYELSRVLHTKLMPLRNHCLVNEFLLAKIDDLEVPYKEKQVQRFAYTFKNDLVQRIFQMGIEKRVALSMFKGDNTVAYRLHRIKVSFPSLREDYALLRHLIPDLQNTSQTATSQSARLTNIRLWISNLTAGNVRQLRLEFHSLIDPAVRKVNDEQQNENISVFFKKLAIFSFLQSGLNKSHLSLTELIPSSVIQDVVQRSSFNMDKLSKGFLDEFYRYFMVENRKTFRFKSSGKINRSPHRFKDYFY